MTSLWADERCYWACARCPIPRRPGSCSEWDTGFDQAAARSRIGPRGSRGRHPVPGVVADCFYGDNPASPTPWGPPRSASCWPPQRHLGVGGAAHTPVEVASEYWLAQPQPAWAVAAGRPLLPRRACRDLVGGGCGAWRLGSRSAAAASVATTDPGRLPGHSSWYLLTNCSRPASRGQQANLAEVVRLYGLRNRVEQGYKQVIGELGWADIQVRSDRAIRRHWTLVLCVLILLPAILAEQLAAPESQVIDPAAMRGTTDQAPGGTGCACLVAGGVAQVRAWLIPCGVAGGRGRPRPPAPIQRLLDVVAGGQPLHLYLPP